MGHLADMKLKIEGKGQTEYVKMGVNSNPYCNPDYIEFEMDYEEAKAFLDLLSQAISKIDAIDNP